MWLGLGQKTTVWAQTPEDHVVYLPIISAEGQNGNASEGYNLFAPLGSKVTYLMGNDGKTVYTWESDYRPGNSVYLLENRNLLRTGNFGSDFNVGGAGGVVQEIAPDGTVVWEFQYSTDQYRLHHDIEPLPNGNVLMIAWERKTEAEAIAAGRAPSLLTDGELWPDHIIEVNPTSGAIVWEWHVWDHLIQDYDPTKDNYGVVADHPELVDLNFTGSGIRPGNPDWNHINSIDYNKELDQILVSVRNFSEIWVIDHSTTTAEAAGHSEGNSGKGGDILYCWGNPQAYGAGDASDQKFFVQHDAQWIEAGYPGEGNILVFNNGGGRPDGNYSSVDEIAPPVDSAGNYTLIPGSAYGPEEQTWVYTADNPTDFYADRISGAQRLPNGNTLICSGTDGYFFEVTADKQIVWEYQYDAGHVFRVTRYAPDHPGLPDMGLAQASPGYLANEQSSGAKDVSGGSSVLGNRLASLRRSGEGSSLGPSRSGGRQSPTGGSLSASTSGQPPMGRTPTQETIDACIGLNENAACAVTTPRGNLIGTCMPVQSQLACVPQGGSPAGAPLGSP
jgi:hypothetical protein